MTRLDGKCEFDIESTGGGFFGEDQATVELSNSPCKAEAKPQSSASGSSGKKGVEEVLADGVGFESGAVVENGDGDNVGGCLSNGDLDLPGSIGSFDGFHGVSDEAGDELSQQGVVEIACDFFVWCEQSELDAKFGGGRIECIEEFADCGDKFERAEGGLWRASEEH